jgi:cytochrome b
VIEPSRVAPAQPEPVWDLGIRLLHWTLAAATCLSLWTGLAGHWTAQHEPAGYVVAAAVCLRFILGFAGRPHARFAQFMQSPKRTLAYLRALRARTAPHYPGHNPLGGWMVVTILTCLSGSAITGFMLTTDAFWGSPGVSLVHECFAYFVLALIAIHVTGIVAMSFYQRQNLLKAMITGRR